MVGSTTLTVLPAALVSIAVTPPNPSVPVGFTQQFTATGTYTNGSSQDLTAQVTWSSTNPTVTIAPTGLATVSATAAGSTTVGATLGGVSGSTTLTVIALTSIAVTPADTSVSTGATQQFTATGTYADNSTRVITALVTWTSSNPVVATIDAGGLATAAPSTAGLTTISATFGAVSGSTSLTVVATLTSISVTPANPSVKAGLTQQFTATGTYTDGSTKDLTTSVTWASSATSVATVSAAGLATTLVAGTTTISAGSGGVLGSTTLSVTP
ncbi:MAG TPA: Ig-like domain-containing protein [Anaeromyxobacter sp.]